MSGVTEYSNGILARSKVHSTPCGAGNLIWHEWGAGEPLVLLHGGSGSWTHWIRNISKLENHFRLICADTPGLGESDMPPGIFSANDFPNGMRMLAELFALGIDLIIGAGVRFHLVGFSMGAIAGGYLISQWPGRLSYWAENTTRSNDTALIFDEVEAGIYMNDLLTEGERVLIPHWQPGEVSAWQVSCGRDASTDH